MTRGNGLQRAGSVLLIALLGGSILAAGQTARVKGAETGSTWRIWDEAAEGMEEPQELPEQLTAKIAEWKQRIETTGMEAVPNQQPETAGTEVVSNQQPEPAPEAAPDQQPEPAPESADVLSELEAETAGEYIFPDVNIRVLELSEVQALTLQEACYAKNEIYARHGRQFVSVELQEYFGEKSWYEGIIPPEAFTDQLFNEYEAANLQMIVEWEVTLEPNGYVLDQAGYDIHNVRTNMGGGGAK